MKPKLQNKPRPYLTADINLPSYYALSSEFSSARGARPFILLVTCLINHVCPELSKNLHLLKQLIPKKVILSVSLVVFTTIQI